MDEEIDFHQALTSAHAENKWLRTRAVDLESSLAQMKDLFHKSEQFWKDELRKVEFNVKQVEKKYEEKFQQSLATIKKLHDDYKELNASVIEKDKEIRRLHEEMMAQSELVDLGGTNVSQQITSYSRSASSASTTMSRENAFKIERRRLISERDAARKESDEWKSQAQEQQRRALSAHFDKEPRQIELENSLKLVSTAKFELEAQVLQQSKHIEALEKTVERLTRENKGFEEQLIELAEAHQNRANAVGYIAPQVHYYAAPPTPVNPYAGPPYDDVGSSSYFYDPPAPPNSSKKSTKAQELRPGAPNPFSFGSV